MSKMNEWVAGASDNEVVDMFNHGDFRLACATWSALGLDLDRTIRIHGRGIGQRLVDIVTSEEYRGYEAHEKMVPEAFKAEFQPASTPPEVGALINGSLLCISNEDASFPECLDSGRMRPTFNAELKQYHWAPTVKEAKESSHYR
jgi:hypothetical protein